MARPPGTARDDPQAVVKAACASTEARTATSLNRSSNRTLCILLTRPRRIAEASRRLAAGLARWCMASRRTWLSISVELIEGRGETVWPRPGRVFAVSKQHTFERFAVAVDDAFARWDRAHLHEFHLFAPDATFETRPIRVADPDSDWDFEEPVTPIRTTKLSILKLCQQFLYVFDLGDDWTHLCTVGEKLIDPAELVGLDATAMPGPLPFWGWGSLPDQYGRRWNDDTGDRQRVPLDPKCRDLPPLRPWWGPNTGRPT